MDRQMIHVLLPRVLMFAAMLAAVIFVTHFILPGSMPESEDAVMLNPVLQTGLFVVLTMFGALIGFWITFGDLIERSGK